MQLVSLDSAIAAGHRFEPRWTRQDLSAWEVTEHRELARVVRSCLDSLPSRYREILILRFGINCQRSTNVGIAAGLGISHQAVRKRLTKATSLLRDMLLDRGIE